MLIIHPEAPEEAFSKLNKIYQRKEPQKPLNDVAAF